MDPERLPTEVDALSEADDAAELSAIAGAAIAASRNSDATETRDFLKGVMRTPCCDAMQGCTARVIARVADAPMRARRGPEDNAAAVSRSSSVPSCNDREPQATEAVHSLSDAAPMPSKSTRTS